MSSKSQCHWFSLILSISYYSVVQTVQCKPYTAISVKFIREILKDMGDTIQIYSTTLMWYMTKLWRNRKCRDGCNVTTKKQCEIQEFTKKTCQIFMIRPSSRNEYFVCTQINSNQFYMAFIFHRTNTKVERVCNSISIFIVVLLCVVTFAPSLKVGYRVHRRCKSLFFIFESDVPNFHQFEWHALCDVCTTFSQNFVFIV